MIPHATTSRKWISLVTIMAALLFSSCEEEVEENKPIHVTIDGTGNHSQTYYFLSDEEGNTIDFNLAANDERVELRSPEPYSQKTYSLTEFFIGTMEDKPYFVATTWSGIEVKALAWKAASSSPDHTLTFFSFSGTGNVAGSVASSDADLQWLHEGGMLFGSRGNTTRLLAMVQEPGTKQTKYRLFDNEGAGYATGNNIYHPHTVDLSLVTEPLPTRTISSPPGMSVSDITVYGVKNKPAPEYYLIDGDFVSLDPLVIPDPGKTFDAYSYSTFFWTESTNSAHFHRNTRSSIDFTPMPVDISVEGSGDNTLTFTTQGTYDFGWLNFISTGKSNYWDFYFPHSSKTRTIKLPTVPTELLEKLGSTTLGTFDQTVFGATDIKSIGGYQDFIQKRDQVNILGQESKSTSIRM